MHKKRLNLGCGSIVLDTWTNVDYALGAWLFKVPGFRIFNKHIHLFSLNWDSRILLHNLNKRFPWRNDTIDCIYCSHVLEHMSREDGLRFLSECHRVLKPGGILRVLVPDLARLVNDYVTGRTPAEEFVEKLGCSYPRHIGAFLISYPHKVMYDSESLKRIMACVGYICKSQPPFESAIGDIEDIESLSGTATTSVIVEGTKPIA